MTNVTKSNGCRQCFNCNCFISAHLRFVSAGLFDFYEDKMSRSRVGEKPHTAKTVICGIACATPTCVYLLVPSVHAGDSQRQNPAGGCKRGD